MVDRKAIGLNKLPSSKANVTEKVKYYGALRRKTFFSHTLGSYQMRERVKKAGKTGSTNEAYSNFLESPIHAAIFSYLFQTHLLAAVINTAHHVL